MRLCFAPMDWITNCATRLITSEIFNEYWNKEDSLTLWTEFMNVDGFLINPHQVIRHILTTPWQLPILQIYWWKEETLLRAAEIIQDKYSLFFSWIELNTWCPSNTVMKVWWWSDMLKDKEKTLWIIKKLSEICTTLPFSLKTRAWINEDDKISQKEFLIKASEYCDKISIHWRTLRQLYIWDADWDFIGEVKKDIVKYWNSNCKVIGNGWLTSYEDAKNNNYEYWVDWVMIWQAAIWNPWIFTEHVPTIEEKYETIIRHLDYYIACDQWFDEKIVNNEEDIDMMDLEVPIKWIRERIVENRKLEDFYPHTIVEFRKFLFQYVKWIPWSKEWKQKVLECKNYKELKDMIEKLFRLYL